LSRAAKGLPHLEPQRNRVIYLLANAHHPKMLRKYTPVHRPKVSQADRNVVRQFFLSDEVSCGTPGKSQFISMRTESGKKEDIQLRYMAMTLSEAYNLFKEEHGKLVSTGFFCELRPKYVKLVGDTPHNVCACRLHEDFIA
jgi:hypothetical protein